MKFGVQERDSFHALAPVLRAFESRPGDAFHAAVSGLPRFAYAVPDLLDIAVRAALDRGDVESARTWLNTGVEMTNELGWSRTASLEKLEALVAAAEGR